MHLYIFQKHLNNICNGNRTEWSPIRSVIIRVINKIGRPRSGSPICLIFLVELRWPAAYFLFFSVFLLLHIPNLLCVTEAITICKAE